jgi:hypothetical protein
MEQHYSSNLTVLVMNLTSEPGTMDAGTINNASSIHSEVVPSRMHDSISSVHLYFVPVLVLFGLITNVSCGLILSLSALHRLPLTVLLATCVLSDALFLVGLFCTWLGTGVEVVEQNIQWCYFLSMLTNSAHFLCTWNQVAVLGHCYLIVATSTVVSALLAKTVAVGVAIVAVVIYVNVTLLTDAQSTDETSYCRPLAAYVAVTQLLNRLGLLINAVFPFLLSVTLVVLCLRTIRCESYVMVNYQTSAHRTASTDSSQQGGKYQQPDDFSRNELSSRLAEAICYVNIVCLVLSCPSLMLRSIHTLREIAVPELKIQDGERISQSIAQYLVYVTYALKGLLLPFLWYPYRSMSVKIVRRSLRLVGAMCPCKRRTQLDAMAALWSHNARVNLISYPHVKVTDV